MAEEGAGAAGAAGGAGVGGVASVILGTATKVYEIAGNSAVKSNELAASAAARIQASNQELLARLFPTARG